MNRLNFIDSSPVIDLEGAWFGLVKGVEGSNNIGPSFKIYVYSEIVE